jgi:hypothetical protein
MSEPPFYCMGVARMALDGTKCDQQDFGINGAL